MRLQQRVFDVYNGTEYHAEIAWYQGIESAGSCGTRMSKSNLSLVATILAIFGVAVLLGHPAWGAVTGAAMLLLAGGIGAGTLRSSSDDYLSERKAAGQKISNSLVTLSSAAILAIYAAGYHRTIPAAEKFEELIARRRAPAPIVAGPVAPIVASTTVVTGIIAPPAVPPSVSPPHKTSEAKPPSKSARKAKIAPAPSGEPAAARSEPPTVAATNEPAADAGASDAAGSTAKYKDGRYLGWGTSRHGDIQAFVEIKKGKIVSTGIAQCRTRYSCTVIVHLPGQVVDRQSAAVDLVSGATESSDAFSDAVSEALMNASE
jgi:uncharacterized protein with FMN-binding domain